MADTSCMIHVDRASEILLSSNKMGKMVFCVALWTREKIKKEGKIL